MPFARRVLVTSCRDRPPARGRIAGCRRRRRAGASSPVHRSRRRRTVGRATAQDPRPRTQRHSAVLQRKFVGDAEVPWRRPSKDCAAAVYSPAVIEGDTACLDCEGAALYAAPLVMVRVGRSENCRASGSSLPSIGGSAFGGLGYAELRLGE